VACVESSANISLAYSNTTPTGPGDPVSYMVPGARTPDAHWVADDIKLATPGGCQTTGYEIAAPGRLLASC
jgi:hypothetical protein